jgi:hypothetical protein
MQQFWLRIAAADEGIVKPWTFAEICRSAFEVEEADMRPAFKRSLRRALQGVVRDNLIICLGTRRGVYGHFGYYPARYVLNPRVLKPDDPRVATLEAHLAAVGLSLAA